MDDLSKSLKEIAQKLHIWSEHIDKAADFYETMMTQRAPVKKASVKEKPIVAASKEVKPVVSKGTTFIKAKKQTDAQKILNILNRNKRGLTTHDLMKKSGFNKKKVQNLIFKLREEGIIRVPQRGVYSYSEEI